MPETMPIADLSTIVYSVESWRIKQTAKPDRLIVIEIEQLGTTLLCDVIAMADQALEDHLRDS